MPWLVPMSPQYVRPYVLFYQLSSVLLNWEWQKEILKACSRLNFDYCLFSRSSDIEGRCQSWWRDRNRRKRPLQSIGEDMMLFCPFVGHQGFGGRFQHLPIAGSASANKGNEEVATGHQCSKVGESRPPVPAPR